jgi:hypothetical protein
LPVIWPAMVLSVLPRVAPSVTTRPTSQATPSPRRRLAGLRCFGRSRLLTCHPGLSRLHNRLATLPSRCTNEEVFQATFALKLGSDRSRWQSASSPSLAGISGFFDLRGTGPRGSRRPFRLELPDPGSFFSFASRSLRASAIFVFKCDVDFLTEVYQTIDAHRFQQHRSRSASVSIDVHLDRRCGIVVIARAPSKAATPKTDRNPEERPPPPCPTVPWQKEQL